MGPSRVSTSIATALIAFLSNAQVTYDDVAVIVNANDPVSVNIGNYFIAARSIPAQNVIALDAPLSEVIDTAQFTDLREQIETHMITNGLTDSINYLVCIKGVPHRIGNCDTLTPICRSFDSMLVPLLGPYTQQLQNPFSGSIAHQYRPETGVYLVTRLDGFTEQDVIDLIDRSGPGQLITMASSTILADINHAPWHINLLGGGMQSALAPLANNGWSVVVDTVFAPVQGLTGVVGFMSIEMAPDADPFPNTWSPGALASELNSFGAYTFDQSQPDLGRRRAADLIASGATGMRGVVTYAYSSMGMPMSTTLNRYLDTLNFNLAESYWAGIPWLRYTDLVIGDPKTSVMVDLTGGMDEVGAAMTAVRYDATNNTLIITAPPGGTGPFLLQVRDPLGREVRTYRASGTEPFHIGDIACGAYIVRVSANDRIIAVGKFAKAY